MLDFNKWEKQFQNKYNNIQKQKFNTHNDNSNSEEISFNITIIYL